MKGQELKYDNCVVIVTGAGGGLGKAYALEFASRGAKVVVNDLGGSTSGEGNNSRAADEVVNEIRRKGGIAVANYNSVEDGEKVVKTALDNFGKIDILVNNAGILRDRSFARISDTDWDLVHKVHLRGSFLVTRAVFPHMKKQKYGRIIMTSSVAGIYGNFGQANYSAAKLGLLGLSNTIAIEGARYNINCNTVAPMGGTRLTQGILPEDLFKEMKPELIAPIVLWLCHNDCDETGGLYEAAAGWFGKYQWARSKGHICRKTLLENVSPESVRHNWDKICDMSDPLYIQSNAEAAGMLASVLEDLKSDDSSKLEVVRQSSQVTGPLSAVGVKLKGVSYNYDFTDLILYALGVGVSTVDDDGLKYLFEGSVDFCPLPTFVIIPAQAALMQSGVLSSIEGWNIDYTQLLHGEQFIEIVKPLQSSGTLTSDIEITDVLDKGSGASLLIDIKTYDEQKDVVALSQFTIFIVGEGGFGGPRTSKRQISLEKPPQRTPDAVDTFTTSIDQAALYRLCGDHNPLHIDPNFSAMGGFEKPIFHGLGFFGIAARAVLKHFCKDDVSKFKAIKTRFAKVVIPGETLVTSMWKEGTRVHFETTIKENSKVCLSGGYVDLVEDCNHRCDQLIKTIASIYHELSATMPDTDDIILWNITHGDKIISNWTFDLRNKKIYNGHPSNGENPTSTGTLEEDDFIKIIQGSVSPQKLFTERRLKMTGREFTRSLRVLMDLMHPTTKL